MASLKFLVNGVILSLFIVLTYGEPNYPSESLSLELNSLTTSIIEKASSVREFRNHQLRRFKRRVVTKDLDDPNDCVTQCNKDHTKNMVDDGTKNANLLVKAVLAASKDGEGKTADEKAAFKKRIEDLTYANLGQMFNDFCMTTKQSVACIQKCPESQLRTIYTWQQSDATDVLCEPGNKNYWNNFYEYITAVNCTNNTETDKPCDGRCGEEISVADVTGPLGIGNADNAYALQFENNSKKNTAAVGPACKNILCHQDCYKPIITQKCGKKAFDLYVRTAKMEPRTSLRILNLMSAVGQNNDCKDFQQ